jgi:CheY-like chemotaxis protein
MPQASPAPQRDSSEQLQQAVADDCAKIIHPQRSEKQRQCRILLVEDSIDNQLMIKTLLKGDSFEIDFANDGVQAIRKGTSKPYDLILMDIQMPVMDGYAATRHLRKMGVKIPILALTAHASPEDRQRCFAAGCTNYLTKPINIGQLKNVIRSYS